MGLDAMLALNAVTLGRLDRFTKLNVLGLLGQTLYEVRRGNNERATLYLAAALVAFQSKKISYALQGALAVDSLYGRLTGSRPLDDLLQGVGR